MSASLRVPARYSSFYLNSFSLVEILYSQYPYKRFEQQQFSIFKQPFHWEYYFYFLLLIYFIVSVTWSSLVSFSNYLKFTKPVVLCLSKVSSSSLLAWSATFLIIVHIWFDLFKKWFKLLLDSHLICFFFNQHLEETELLNFKLLNLLLKCLIYGLKSFL